MHLKSLNLKGFKSFADRSVLSFEPGITAIVGPNGSGKSNISDAVLWVLGERNAKTLRGQAMEDVVFAGSSVRKPVGVAEVDLVLDNSDETLSLEFNEVVLTRRMYRNGESEYLINGVQARRMDVLDILHDSGLGASTPSIISQGNLDSLLQSKPEDRRAIIEEAAGVLKHKQRKARSERKLELMDQHLVRVKDITAEIERQLRPLERKAKRALAYKDLAVELADLNLALAVDDLRLLQKKWEEAIQREAGFVQGIEQARDKIEASEARINDLQRLIREDSENTGDLSRRYQRARSVTERLEAILLVLGEKQRFAQDREAELTDKLHSSKEKRTYAAEQAQRYSEQAARLEAECTEAQAVIDAATEEHRTVCGQKTELSETLDAFVREERMLTTRLEGARTALSDAREALSANVTHEKIVAARKKELQEILAEEKARHEAMAARAQEHSAKLENVKKEEKAAREGAQHASNERERAYKAYEALRDEVSVMVSEVKGLEEFERSRESGNPTLAWIGENEGRFQSGIRKLAELIQAPPEWEKTVEWLLEDDLKALVVTDLESAKMIVEALQEHPHIDEVTLLPQRDSSSAVAKGNVKAARLMDVVECESGYEDVVASLIGDVCLCATLDEAVKAHIADKEGLRFATRDGCLVWQNGKISAGVDAQTEEGILAHRRRLEQARAKVESLKGALEKAQKAKMAADAAFEDARLKSLGLSQERAQAQGNEEALRDSCARSAQKLAGLQREDETLTEELFEAQKVLAGAEPTSKGYEGSIEALTASLDEVKTKRIEAEQRLIPLEEAITRHKERMTEARLSVATLVERANSVRRQIEAAQREHEGLSAEIEKASVDLAAKNIVARRIKPLLAVFEGFLRSVEQRTQALSQATHDAHSSTSKLHASLEEARKASHIAHDAHDTVNEKLSALRVEKGRLEIQVESAIRVIKEDCKTPLERALSLPALDNREEVEEQAFKLRRRIANMGTINPDAAVEYEELKTRYTYMESQLEDMMSARRALAKIIRVIDNRMKEDFMRTFEQVNAHFQEVFMLLFPGGSAELSLVDPEEPETSGIEVSAQPRGKRITKMMLMSGGEKSLTALALLFAVYRIRSAPFYILDEVEAALDDTNLRRLCGYFDSLRETTQLILITHQRRTMELANVLYGISMQADGVTRVVSQRLEHADVAKGA